MSKMIPRETIDALRLQVDVTLDNYGIQCDLYIPTVASYNEFEEKDAYATPEDLEYTRYQCLVFIEWGASVYRLKKLGLYTEGMLPIVARFGNRATVVSGSEAGEVVDVDICKNSYFTIEPEYIPNNYVGAESFELVDEAIRGMHDAVIVKAFSITPRRV